ncbi:hypothetical protein ACJJTC_014901 [Scirpophaga incertulas]
MFNNNNLYDDVEDLLLNDHNYTVTSLVTQIESIINGNIQPSENIISYLVDTKILEDISNIIEYEHIPVFFGKTLRDIKLVVIDDNLREHEIFVKYNNFRKLVITSVAMPHSEIQDQEYNSLQDIVMACKMHVNRLSAYFTELQSIDRMCTVMEPINPSFKDDYRRIRLDDRVWLHLEVSPEGLGTNIYLVGQSEKWNSKLQAGLLSWDHDKDIVENISRVFDLTSLSSSSMNSLISLTKESAPLHTNVCSICLCTEMQDNPSVPLPLCLNANCGVYFHRYCLYQWLVALDGGRIPAFGVASGSCPSCFKPTTCSEKDN